MKRRQILLDEESDRILAELAESHSGDRSRAVRAILRAHKTTESTIDELERAYAPELLRQKLRSEKSFREGTAVPWEQVKRHNKL
jgi:hypothetical protein